MTAPEAREIQLSRGKVAVIDACDFGDLAGYRWYAYAAKGREYAVRNVSTPRGQRQVRMHCQILGVKGIDHANGDGLDNRRSNLRPATQGQNTANARKRSHHGGLPTSSRFKGVSWHRPTQKWSASICRDGRSRHLGLYRTEVEAARAYNDAARELFGAFARLNEIEGES